MSNRQKYIAIYHNLPSGGAKLTCLNTYSYLKNIFKTKIITEPSYQISSFVKYLYISLCISPLNQRKIIEKTKHDALVVYHSWMVKSPSILQYTKKPKIYICHEPMREYYDKSHIRSQNAKERIINLLRLPIKFLDRRNIRSENTVVVANSKLSKKLIDIAYGVESTVIYPGIDITKFKVRKKLRRRNQVICVSAINKYKNQSYLVDVIAEVPPTLRPTLLLIGNGSDKIYLDSLLRKSKRLGVIVKVKQNVSDNSKIIELMRSKVFLYAPYREPFGIVIEEAIAAGLPILTSNNGGGYNEVIDSRNGVILNNLDTLSWAKSLRTLLTNNDKFKVISEYNVKYARKYFDSKIMNLKILNLINERI